MSPAMERALQHCALYGWTRYGVQTTAALVRRGMLSRTHHPTAEDVTSKGWAYLVQHGLVLVSPGVAV